MHADAIQADLSIGPAGDATHDGAMPGRGRRTKGVTIIETPWSR